MSTRDLINAIAAGDAIEIENAFNSVMAEKISARIDDMRIDVAQNLFAEQVEEIEEETELTLEEYSVEEIESFMQTEEFEQLDELSKDTLSSYRDKARDAIKSGVAKHTEIDNPKGTFRVKDLIDRHREVQRQINNHKTGIKRATQKIKQQ